jgi:diacylglycerol kinase (ATP)
MNAPMKSKGGLGRIGRAFIYSMHGLKAAWQHEHAFRQELMLAAVLLPVAIFAPVTSLERALLFCAMLFVLVVELLNSSIEAVVDRFGNEIHELAKRAKDIGSAAVFLADMIFLIIWGVILWPVVRAWAGW